MMWAAVLYLVLCVAALYLLIKAANFTIKHSSSVATSFHLSEFIVSFFIVAIISVLPEAALSIISALKGEPHIGVGILLGSNIADLTLVFGLAALFSFNGLRVKSEILKKDYFYLFLIVLPIILGFDGSFSRTDGIVLILSGIVFFLTLSLESKMFKKKADSWNRESLTRSLILLSCGVLAIAATAYFALTFGLRFAELIGVPAMLISLTMLSIGTCLPELIFSLRSVRTKHQELALGDLLGTVITDATIVLGIVSLISPITVSSTIIYVTGFAMCLAGLVVILFLKFGKELTKKEGVLLIFLYILYLIAELVASKMV